MAYISVTNTLVNGNVSDATQVNTNFTDIINGLSDGTKDIRVLTARIGGAEKLKIWTYSHTIEAADLVTHTFNTTITAVTLANIRNIFSVGKTGTYVYAWMDLTFQVYVIPQLTTTTNLQVQFGTDWVAGDVISTTIIEAI